MRISFQITDCVSDPAYVVENSKNTASDSIIGLSLKKAYKLYFFSSSEPFDCYQISIFSYIFSPINSQFERLKDEKHDKEDKRKSKAKSNDWRYTKRETSLSRLI